MTIATTPLVVNSDRLTRSLQQLAEVGKLPNGGVCRVAFTRDDLLARQLVHTWMTEAGMTVRVDAAGNIIDATLADQRVRPRWQQVLTLTQFQLVDTSMVA